MTTVAVRDGVMASDSQAAYDQYPYEQLKIFRVMPGGPTDPGLIGVSGTYMDCLEFVDWYRAGADRNKTPEWKIYGERDNPDFSALVLHVDGLWYWTEHFLPLPIREPFWAIGSGRMAALAAMHCGLSAEEAIEIAMKCDINTGGRVVSWRIEKKGEEAA